MKSFLKPALELQRGFKYIKRLGYVAQYKCVCCEMLDERQKTRLNVHHLAGIGDGKKASDLLTFPLCEIHHNLLHKGIAEFEKAFKSQIEFIGITNERIFKDNVLKAKDLYHYELVRDWVESKIRERNINLKLAIDI
jgi:hypothetical protein